MIDPAIQLLLSLGFSLLFIVAGIHNMTPEYAQKMISKGFQLVTISSDQRFMTAGAKSTLEKLKKVKSKEESKAY